jgi:hypothetical protein
MRGELNPPVKKPFNTFHWFVLGVICGIALGIITVLVVAAVKLATRESPYNPESWEIVKWGLSRAVFIFGMGGAVFGGFVGIVIGIVRSDRE